MDNAKDELTLKEAIRLYPDILEEKLSWGSLSTEIGNTEPPTMWTAFQASFQFCGNGGYRTNSLLRNTGQFVTPADDLQMVIHAIRMELGFKAPEVLTTSEKKIRQLLENVDSVQTKVRRETPA